MEQAHARTGSEDQGGAEFIQDGGNGGTCRQSDPVRFLSESKPQSADAFAVLQYPILCLTLLPSKRCRRVIFLSNALLFVHDLSRPHSHACYPNSAHNRVAHAAYATHHLTIIPANSLSAFSSPTLPRLIYPVHCNCIMTHGSCRSPLSSPTSTSVVYPLVYTLMTRSWMDLSLLSSLIIIFPFFSFVPRAC